MPRTLRSSSFIFALMGLIAITLAPSETQAAARGPVARGGWLGPATFGAQLVKCSSVTEPSALSGCGTDPLTQGIAAIDNVGNVDVEVSGASPSQTYSVVLRSPNGGYQRRCQWLDLILQVRHG